MTNPQMAQLARHHMIDGQLLPNRIISPEIIAAMGVTPRERFVPQAFSQCAYVDESIPLGYGRFMMEPVILAQLIQALGVNSHEKILVVGGNTGYSATILAQLGAYVTVVEEQEEMVAFSRRLMKEMGLATVEIYKSAMAKGYKAGAPYHAILIDGAVETVPEILFGQLEDDGRLAVVENCLSTSSLVDGVGQAVIWRKLSDGAFGREVLQDASVPVILSLKAVRKFVL